jgi:hypothetical protein
MATRKKGKAKGKARATRTTKAAKKKPARRPARKAAAASGASAARIAALEAENRRLRDELAELRGRLEQQEQAVPAFNLTADEDASDQM